MSLLIRATRPAARRHRAGWRIVTGIAAIGIAGLSGCNEGPGLVLTQLTEARRLVADLRVQFTKGADASNRAVMAYHEEGAATALREAEAATEAGQRDSLALQPILQKLAYAEEGSHLEEFNRLFAEYRSLDSTILGLAVENTNLKAQRLSFGPAREAAQAVHDSLELVARSGQMKDACRVEALVARAEAAVQEIQALQAPHIAEADDAAMSRMEQQMARAETAARGAISSLKRLRPARGERVFERRSASERGPASSNNELVPPPAGPALAAATTALDRFARINTELIALSRRNSNVRSLALSLGRKRTLTAACDDSLNALQDTLAKRDFTATR